MLFALKGPFTPRINFETGVITKLILSKIIIPPPTKKNRHERSGVDANHFYICLKKIGGLSQKKIYVYLCIHPRRI